VADLIFSQKYGKRSFNLDIPDRTACMEALYRGEEFANPDAPESIANILGRYAELEDLFPEELAGAALPYFMDWLVENVHLVEITAYSDDDAYTIFETMNDRGLSLAPADMLKGYLLANITDTDRRTRADRLWKDRIQALADLGKDEDADGIKSWLRSQYAENIRERRRGAVAQDFELIGTEFHRWVRANEKASVSRRAANSPGSSSATSLFMAAGMNACGVPLRPRSRDSNVSTSMLSTTSRFNTLCCSRRCGSRMMSRPHCANSAS